MEWPSDELRALVEGWGDLDRTEQVDLVRRLRSSGLSLGEIERLVPVSVSTISAWCCGVELTGAQREAIRVRRAPRRGVSRDTQWRRRQEIEGIRRQARIEAPALLRQPMFAAGVALYWAEGSKTTRRLQMANADPRLLAFFVTWVRSYCLAQPEFSLHINLHADNDAPAAERFWRTVLPIDDPRFTKPFIKPDGTGHRKNHLPHGVCRVTVRRSTDAWLRMMTWIDELGSGGWLGDVATLPPGR